MPDQAAVTGRVTSGAAHDPASEPPAGDGAIAPPAGDDLATSVTWLRAAPNRAVGAAATSGDRRRLHREQGGAPGSEPARHGIGARVIALADPRVRATQRCTPVGRRSAHGPTPRIRPVVHH